MKTPAFLALATLILGTSALAGSERCDVLQDAYENDGFQKSTYDQSDSTLTFADAYSDLPKGLANQIAAYAKFGGSKLDNDYETATALGMISDGSEGGEFFISRKKAGKYEVTHIGSYPGGNPYGLFFDGETTKILATISDGDFDCKE